MDKIQKIIQILNKEVLEKEEVIAVSFLAALAGLNIFLLGPPGTAKSLISRRLSSAFETDAYFEYLMQRFSTPEEIFGPISLTELKQNNYIRKTDGYLPKADFAFLDEIWKSSPAVLNTLLTIINEKKFRNGTTIEEVPLKTLISASNEVPPENQGLEALYDRFLVRLMVLPTGEKESFEKIIQRVPAESNIKIDEKITNDEFELWQLEIDEVQLSRETLDIIQDIRIQVEKKNKSSKNKKIYISDRRWQRAGRLLKAAAFFCDRKITNIVDTLLLRHCLWSTDSDREWLQKTVEKAVRENGLTSSISFDVLESKKNELDKEINEEFYYEKDIYKTVQLEGSKRKYLKGIIHYSHQREYYVEDDPDRWLTEAEYYIDIKRMGTDEDFHPLDANGNELEHITCNFKGQNSFSTEVEDNDIYLKHLDEGKRMHSSAITRPPIEFNKGDVKQGVNQRLFSSLKETAEELDKKIQQTIDEINKKKNDLSKQIYSPFVPELLRNIAIESVTDQLNRISVVRTDCERLQSTIDKAEKAQ